MIETEIDPIHGNDAAKTHRQSDGLQRRPRSGNDWAIKHRAAPCRTFSTAVRLHLKEVGSLPSDEAIHGWVDQVRDRIHFAAAQRDSSLREFAATMIAIVSDGTETLIVQVGDGCAALKHEGEMEWLVPIWPDHGEYASTTSFITDERGASLRILRDHAPVSAFAVMTDGLERLALDFAAAKPFNGFFNGVWLPLLDSTVAGCDRPLSNSLRDFLNGGQVCARIKVC
ncbi:MAG: hypothetical protein EON54_07250 [Alcaligenaceae bacterium]|nr:MAG: hypothetical protein EON54_07250 [Alcaligenaceae bacterium]